MNASQISYEGVEKSEVDLFKSESELRQLRSCGRFARVFRNSRLAHPERIELGDYSQIDEGVMIFPGIGVKIGRHVHIAFMSSISGGGVCAIKDYVSIGASVRIVTGSEIVNGSGMTNPTIPAELRSVSRGYVTINAHSVIFTNSIVLPGVTVGEGVVVAAGSIVHHDLLDWRVYAGNPLVCIGVRPKDEILRRAQELERTELSLE